MLVGIIALKRQQRLHETNYEAFSLKLTGHEDPSAAGFTPGQDQPSAQTASAPGPPSRPAPALLGLLPGSSAPDVAPPARRLEAEVGARLGRTSASPGLW